MERLFSILTATAILMIVISGVGVYLSSRIIVANANEAVALSAAKGVSQTLGEQLSLFNSTLDKMVDDQEIVAALKDNDKNSLETISARLEKYLPAVRKIRLLPVGTIEPDDINAPKMGFGDIDMVKATFQNSPLPAIQGDEGPDRHLAITRKVMQGNQAVGVILASMSYDFIDKSVKDAVVENAYMEIRQDKLLITKAGENSETDEDLKQVPINGTGWNIRFSDPNNGGIGQTALILGLILIPIFVSLVIFHTCFEQLSVLLAQDQDWILRAFKDVLAHRPKGSYPVTLKGMNTVIASMLRYEHDLEQNNATALKDTGDDFELEGFFDEMSDVLPNDLKKSTSSFKGKVVASSEYTVEENNSTSPPKPEQNAPSTQEIATQKAVETVPEKTKKTNNDSGIFRAYDIRGIVGKTLTNDVVYDIGRALASEAKELGCKTIVVGRDGRNSSPELSEHLSKGIMSTGCHVLDIGMVPTPVLYFVIQHTDGRTGVMITGSHNPAEYNGLKMMIKGETLADSRIQQLKERIDNQAFSAGDGSIEQNGMFESEYIGTLCDDIQVTRPMKIVVDCGNGAAGELAPVIFKNLGCEVIELFCEVDGNFPNHHPDPSKPENLATLIKTVKENNADVGLAFDGDGDRLGVVDSNGKIIWPDRQMMLFAKDVLAGKPGSEIIFDVKCSRHLPDQIVKFGGRPLMWKTGHSFMKAKLKETGAKLAGEMSGHIFFNDRWFGFDDALYSAARLLQILSEDPRHSAQVFAEFPDSINTPELNVELAEGENFTFIKGLFASAKFTGGKITDIDGMRIDFSDGWGLVRASNTTPSLVIRFEADSKEALENIQAQFRDLMRDVKPDIKLPF